MSLEDFKQVVLWVERIQFGNSETQNTLQYYLSKGYTITKVSAFDTVENGKSSFGAYFTLQPYLEDSDNTNQKQTVVWLEKLNFGQVTNNDSLKNYLASGYTVSSIEGVKYNISGQYSFGAYIVLNLPPFYDTSVEIKNVKTDVQNFRIEVDGKIADIKISSDGITAEIESAKNEIANLKISADGIKTEIENTALKTKTTLEQTAEKFKTEVKDSKNQAISSFTQSANEIATNVKSSADSTVSSFSQTAEKFVTDITDSASNAKSQISQSVSSISQEVTDASDNISKTIQTAAELEQSVKDASGNISTAVQTAKELTTQVESASGEVSTAVQTAKELTTQVESASGEVSTAVQTAQGFTKTVSDASTTVNTALNKVGDLETSITETSSKLSTATQTVDGFDAKVQEVNTTLTITTDTINELSTKTEATNKKLSDAEQTVDGFTTRVETSNTKLTTQNSAIDSLKTNITTTTDKLSTATQTVDGFDNTISNTNTRITNITNSVGNLESSITDKSTKLTNIQTSIDGLNIKVSDNTTNVDNLTGQVTTLKNDVGEISATASALTTKFTTLDGDVSTLQQKADAINLEVTDTIKAQDAKITVLSDKIDTSVTDLKTGYQSAISQSANEINSTITSEIAGVNTRIDQTDKNIELKVASIAPGDNLIEHSKLQDTTDIGAWQGTLELYDNACKVGGTNFSMELSPKGVSKWQGKQLTISFDVAFTEEVTNRIIYCGFKNGTENPDGIINIATGNSNFLRVNTIIDKYYNDPTIIIKSSGIFIIKNLKIELGSTATAWTPSLFDVGIDITTDDVTITANKLTLQDKTGTAYKVFTPDTDDTNNYVIDNKFLKVDAAKQSDGHWALNQDGSGQLATNAISWDVNGNLTFGKRMTDTVNENIVVGGKNLLLDSSTFSSWLFTTGSTLTLSTDFITINGVSQYYKDTLITPGKTYTLSFKYSGNGTLTCNGEDSALSGDNISFKKTFTPTTTFIRILFNVTGSNVLKINTKSLQLEAGYNATEWTPAIEDIQETIKNLKITDLQGLTDFSNSITSDLQTQIDGKVETYYEAGLPSNTRWENDERQKHIGDSYVDTTTGIAYYYDSTFVWKEITDTAKIKALALAQSAQDTADGKRTIFINTPTVPYQIGDMWAGGSTSDLKVATTGRLENETFTESDWVLASKYTDDTLATSASSKADTAQTRADAAYTLGNIAKNKLDNWALDTVISPLEKTQMKTEVSSVNADIIKVKADLTLYELSDANNYETKANRYVEVLNHYINLEGDVTIDETLWSISTSQSNYYNARTQTLNNIASAARMYAYNIGENAKQVASNALVNYSKTVTSTLTDLQGQIDGNIDTWFYDDVPTLENAPYTSWTDITERTKHIGDLYYDKDGKVYRFKLQDGKTDIFEWVVITDTDLTKALGDAKKAQDTADGKRRVFIQTPTDTDNYDIGDLWVNANYTKGTITYTNELLRCQSAKVSGTPFLITHWTLASKYTDDTVANAASLAASNAKTAADNAQTDATAANNKLILWASDNVISPVEKQELYKELILIQKENAQYLQSYTDYNIGSLPSSFLTAFNNYKDLLTNYTADKTTETTLTTDVKNNFITKQSAYYDERKNVLNIIAKAAQDYANEKVSALNTALSKTISDNLTNAKNYADTQVSTLKTQVDSKVEAYFETYEPSLTNEPASLWTSDSDKTLHENDTFTKIDDGQSWVWYNNNGTFEWKKITDKATSDALDKLSTSVSKKCQTFITNTDVTLLQTDAYNVGDFWVNVNHNTTPIYKNELLRCKISKLSGTAFSWDHWTPASNFAESTVFTTLQSTADEAHTWADSAKTKLTAWAADGVISPLEKQSIKDESVRISQKYSESITNAALYSVNTTNLITYYNAYKTNLNTITSSTDENVAIPSGFSTNQTNFYNELTTVLSNIASKGKDYATSQVSNAITKINNTKNLLINSANLVNSVWLKESGVVCQLQDDDYWKILSTTTTGNNGIYQDVTISPNTTYNISFSYKTNTNAFIKISGIVTGTTYKNETLSSTSKSFSFTTSATETSIRIYLYLYNTSGEIYIKTKSLKLEIGSTSTAWTANPSDEDAKLTNIGKGGIYTGTLTADQIVAGTISADRIDTDQILSSTNQWQIKKAGDGYLAGGNIQWDASGNVNVKGNFTLTTGKTVTDAITHAVDNIQVGGINLLAQNNLRNGYWEHDGTTLTNFVELNNGRDYTTYDYVDVNNATQLTITLFETITDAVAGAGFIYCINEAKTTVKNLAWITWTTPQHYTWDLPTGTRYVIVNLYYCKKYKYKVEVGNKSTDWSPAPEDVQQYTDTAVDNIQVGGRNLVKESGIARTQTRTIGSENNRPFSNFLLWNAPMTVGKQYTCTIYGNITGTAICTFYQDDGNISWGDFIKEEEGVYRVHGTYQANNNWNSGFTIYCFGIGTIQIDKIKLEVGNKGTDYTEAPEDIAATYTTKSEFKVANDAITSLVQSIGSDGSKLETKVNQTALGYSIEAVNSVQIGTVNLFDYSEIGKIITCDYQTPSIDLDNYIISFTHNNSDNDLRLGNFLSGKELKTGDYTIRMYIKATQEINNFAFNFCDVYAENGETVDITTEYKLVELNFKNVQNYITQYYNGFLDFEGNGNGVGATIYVKQLQIVYGNKIGDWQPSQKDLGLTYTTKSEFKVANDAITSLVTGLGLTGEITNSSITQTASAINTKVSKIDTTGTISSAISQSADNISLKVKNTGINIDDGTVSISAGTFSIKDSSGNACTVFDDTGKLYTSYIHADELLSNGNTWGLLKDGSGWLANKNITWDTAGNTIISGTLKTAITSDVVSSVNNLDEKTTANLETTKNSILGTVTSTTQDLSSIISQIATAPLLENFTDPTFSKGLNGLNIYNNSGNNSGITLTWITDSTAPNNSGKIIRYSLSGSNSVIPGIGGFYFANLAAANKIFVTKIIAKIPTGYTIEFETNTLGIGTVNKWITSNAGTGKYETYIYYIKCAPSGIFLTTNFYYFKGTLPSTALNFDIAFAGIYDVSGTPTAVKINENTSSIALLPDKIATMVDKRSYNLMLNSNLSLINNGYLIGQYKLMTSLIIGKRYVITFCYTLPSYSDVTQIGVYQDDGRTSIGAVTTKGNKITSQLAFTASTSRAFSNVIRFYQMPESNTKRGCVIHWATLVQEDSTDSVPPLYWFASNYELSKISQKSDEISLKVFGSAPKNLFQCSSLQLPSDLTTINSKNGSYYWSVMYGCKLINTALNGISCTQVQPLSKVCTFGQFFNITDFNIGDIVTISLDVCFAGITSPITRKFYIEFYTPNISSLSSINGLERTYTDNLTFVDNVWQRISITIARPSDNNGWIMFKLNEMNSLNCYIKCAKLEYGAIATDYDYKTLQDTGIDINNKKITLTADNTSFITNSGIKAAEINESGLITRGVETFGGSNGKFIAKDNKFQFLDNNGNIAFQFAVDDSGFGLLQYFKGGEPLYNFGPSGIKWLKNSSNDVYTTSKLFVIPLRVCGDGDTGHSGYYFDFYNSVFKSDFSNASMPWKVAYQVQQFNAKTDGSTGALYSADSLYDLRMLAQNLYYFTGNTDYISPTDIVSSYTNKTNLLGKDINSQFTKVNGYFLMGEINTSNSIKVFDDDEVINYGTFASMGGYLNTGTSYAHISSYVYKFVDGSRQKLSYKFDISKLSNLNNYGGWANYIEDNDGNKSNLLGVLPLETAVYNNGTTFNPKTSAYYGVLIPASKSISNTAYMMSIYNDSTKYDSSINAVVIGNSNQFNLSGNYKTITLVGDTYNNYYGIYDNTWEYENIRQYCPFENTPDLNTLI